MVVEIRIKKDYLKKNRKPLKERLFLKNLSPEKKGSPASGLSYFVRWRTLHLLVCHRNKIIFFSNVPVVVCRR